MNRKISFASILVIMTLMLSACGVTGLTFAQNPLPQAVNLSSAPVAQAEATLAPTETTSAPQSSAVTTTGGDLLALQTALENIYAKDNPSVVTVNVSTQVAASNIPFGRNNPNGYDNNTPSQSGLGSGFIWDTNGHIVTNNHVVDGATDITVTFSDGKTVKATLVGADLNSDLAVIKVDVAASYLKPVKLADSTKVKVGQLVIAIGNPYGQAGTMTMGIISGLDRSLPVDLRSSNSTGSSYTIPDVIQTDAPINPGNSGGILADINGDVIGVTSAIESMSGSSAGIGFVIPSAIVKEVVPVLIAKGSYEHTYLGLSGVTMNADIANAMNISADQTGVLVGSVVVGGPADKAGLKGGDQQVDISGSTVVVGGDIITAINDQAVKTFEDLVSYLAYSTHIGESVSLTILRQGKEQKVSVTLAARPESSSTSSATATPNQ